MIESLTQHAGWPVLVDWLHTRMEPTKKAVLNGLVDTHENYLTATGFLKGCHEVLDAPAKVAQLVLNEKLRREERAEDEAE